MARQGSEALRRAEGQSKARAVVAASAASLHVAAETTEAIAARRGVRRFSGAVRLDLIDVAPRLRPVDPHWVEVIAKSFAEIGQQQPVKLVVEPGGRFALDGSGAGAHRVAAARRLGQEEIDATWIARADVDKARARLPEIVENLIRNDLNALSRAQHLAEYKGIHEGLYPDVKRGGDRGNQHSGGKKRQSEIFSFSQEAALHTGLSRRAVEIAVSIWHGLSEASRKCLMGTDLANNQATLRAIAVHDEKLQAKIIALLLSDDPPATVGDAVLIAQGKKPPSINDKLFRNVSGGLTRLNAKSRAVIFETYEDEIVALFRRKGIVK